MPSLQNIRVYVSRKMKIGMETNMRLGMGEEAGMRMGRRYGRGKDDTGRCECVGGDIDK